MSGFYYQEGLLHAEGVPLDRIVEEFGLPCYVYSRREIESCWQAFKQALAPHKHLICYAVKANSNLAVLNLLARLGSGFDIVSAGELYRVLEAGGDSDKVVFSGVGKRADEIRFALEQKIKCFNIESESELTRLNTIAADMNVTAPISFRVNPDVDSRTHPYISTGLSENKFGIAFETALQRYREAATMNHINVVGIDCHIGSQITTLSPFEDALKKLLILLKQLERNGIRPGHIDVGGGLGISYREETPPSPDAYVRTIVETLTSDDYEIIIEPGRRIVGSAGALLTEVQYLKTTPERNFAVVDAAMNDFIRPSFYGGWHDIRRIVEASDAEQLVYDVVGPVCETADFLGKDRALRLKQGDVLAISDVGAYGFSMASNYNSRPRVAEIMVDGDKAYEVRKRETFAELVKGESRLPE